MAPRLADGDAAALSDRVCSLPSRMWKHLYLYMSNYRFANGSFEWSPETIHAQRFAKYDLEMTVAEVIEFFIVDHAEEHLAQVQIAVRG